MQAQTTATPGHKNRPSLDWFSIVVPFDVLASSNAKSQRSPDNEFPEQPFLQA
jgi:hypothetical protein